ncbi:MAG: TatD family hydrolase [Candidatus Promineifilaceae bacterium]
MLIDTHCHLDFERFDEDRDEVLQRARDAGVRAIVVPAIDLNNCSAVLALAERYVGVQAAVGVHPNSTSEWHSSWIDLLRPLAVRPSVVAIGEIGLDYYWEDAPHEAQHRAFTAQLELAAELSLPVIVHNREAGEDVIRLLSESSLASTERPGVLHSFSDTLDVAMAGIDLGFYIGLTGPVTFKNADDLRQIVSALPLERILVETDAPFLAPQPRRGKRNEPAYIIYMVEQIAELFNLSVEEVARNTTENARRLFGAQLDSDEAPTAFLQKE